VLPSLHDSSSFKTENNQFNMGNLWLQPTNQQQNSTIRKFLQDGDTVIMEGQCEAGEVRVGFGDCVGKVLPAKPFGV
jgi:hypothetical protein